MIPILQLEGLDAGTRTRLMERATALLDDADAAVRPVLERVRAEGDGAVSRFLREVDGVELAPERFIVEPAAIAAAQAACAPQLLDALRRSAANLERFHRAQLEEPWELEVEPGVIVGERFPPLRAAGLYVPFGKAVYPSSALMLTVPARVAGVERIVLATGVDPATGEIPAAVLTAAALGGATEIWRVSGTPAVAAFAWGTETLRRVDVVAGPGGRYVEAAKRLVRGVIGVDMDAGPSEILVLALDDADADIAAADLLSEAEHGPDSAALAVCADQALAARIAERAAARLAELPEPRRGWIEAQAAAGRSAIVVAASREEAFAFAEEWAPEHLVIHADDADRLAASVRSAGTVCIGPWTPSPAGNFAAGTNHVLPTGRAARYASGLGVWNFLRRQSYERLTRAGAASLRPTIAAYAAVEGLPAHLAAFDARLDA